METFNIDTIIFVGFLIVNIVLGLTSSKGIKTIKEYAVGNRRFSTGTIVATTVATWICGETFFSTITETYQHGLYFLIPCIIGFVINFFLIGYFLAPRMDEFIGKLSIAEAMGDLFGNKVRLITAISGFIGVSGFIAVQLTIAGIIFNYVFGLSELYGIIISGLIITMYSSLGGIKSVTFTDVIQFFTFGAVIPIITYQIFTSTGDIDLIFDTIKANPNFDLDKVFDFSTNKTLYYSSLFLFCLIPSLNPAEFQRISMARNTRQVTKVFYITGICIFVLMSIIAWFSLTILSNSPNIPIEELVKDYVFNSTAVGYKGLLLIGITAMVMSTADSYINCSSVLFTYDFCKSLKYKLKNELLSARIISFFIGLSGILVALILNDMSLFNLAIFTASFFIPIVSVPFIMAIFGFRSTEKSVLFGMSAGFITNVIWHYSDSQIDSNVPAMLANLITLISSHYLLKQAGGWVGIKDERQLIAIRTERKRQFRKIIQNIKEFDILLICKSNYPNSEGLISILGLFVMIVTFSSVNNLSMQLHNKYRFLLDILYPLTLCSSSALISYPLWLQQWKNTEFIAVVWNVIMFSALICFSFFMELISNFAEIQLMVFMINIIVIISLTKWQWALFNILAGIALTAILCNNYINLNLIDHDFTSSQFKIIYLLLLVSSSLILFFKPKQQKQELTEQRSNYLGEKVNDIDNELKKSVEVKNEFLRNLEHEAHTPIVGITTMGQVLFENYDKLTEEQKRKGLKEIAKSSERLSSLVNNMIDVSKLSSLNYVLNKKQINLSDLIYQRLDHCKKLYLENKDLEFICDIEDDLLVNCDEHYITSTLDNLIVNAITYSKDGRITIEFKKNNDLVKFKITDEGIGIPQKELYAIFGTFTVSSKTKTPAGGRGLGLALCKGTIEAHKGQIWCKSNGKKGSTFTFTLPIEESIKLIEARLTKSELQKQK